MKCAPYWGERLLSIAHFLSSFADFNSVFNRQKSCNNYYPRYCLFILIHDVSYLITTHISGVPHAVTPNPISGKFELIKIVRDSEISRAYCSPTKTGAVQILNWIRDNDAELSLQNLTVQPEARFFK